MTTPVPFSCHPLTRIRRVNRRRKAGTFPDRVPRRHGQGNLGSPPLRACALQVNPRAVLRGGLAAGLALTAASAGAASSAGDSAPALSAGTITLSAVIFAVALFAGILLLLELGRRVGMRRQARDTEGARAGMGAVEGAVFALLGLLIAFTFSGASARFETRRQLIVEEANSIGTAWLRLDLLPAAAQPALRELFRQYVDSRLAAYRALPDIAAARAELERSLHLQGEIWRQAVAGSQTPEGQRATMLLLPALNQMFDIVTQRTTAVKTHPPTIIFVQLGMLAMTSAFLAGFGMAGGKRRSWIHIVGFATVVAICVYVILDLEYPRLGFIRIDAADQLLLDVRQSMD
jgi:hypothetical protein